MGSTVPWDPGLNKKSKGPEGSKDPHDLSTSSIPCDLSTSSITPCFLTGDNGTDCLELLLLSILP